MKVERLSTLLRWLAWHLVGDGEPESRPAARIEVISTPKRPARRRSA